MGRKVALLALAMVAVLAAPAHGHDHRMPDAFLETSAGEQRGAAYVSEWSHGDGRFCVTGVGDGIRAWGEPIRFVPGEHLSIRFDKTQRPQRVRVLAWRAGYPVVNEPVGPPETVETELERARHHGRRVWRATFDAPLTPDLYLDVTAHWHDVDKCGSQSVSWTFHARAF